MESGIDPINYTYVNFSNAPSTPSYFNESHSEISSEQSQLVSNHHMNLLPPPLSNHDLYQAQKNSQIHHMEAQSPYSSLFDGQTSSFQHSEPSSLSSGYYYSKSFDNSFNMSQHVIGSNNIHLPSQSSEQNSLPSSSSNGTFKLAEETLQNSSQQFFDISPYFIYSQAQAAQLLGCSEGTLGRRWRDASMNKKWPFRSVAKIDREINMISFNIGNAAPVERASMEIQLASLLKERQELSKPVFIRMSSPPKSSTVL